jgi:hypothetical protein
MCFFYDIAAQNINLQHGVDKLGSATLRFQAGSSVGFNRLEHGEKVPFLRIFRKNVEKTTVPLELFRELLIFVRK